MENNVSLKNNKKNIIVILSIVCLLLIVFILYFLFVNKNGDNSNTSNNENKQQEQAKYVEVPEGKIPENVNDKLTETYINNTINVFNDPFSDRSRDIEQHIFGLFSSQDKTLIENLSPKAVAFIGLSHYVKEAYQNQNINFGMETCIEKSKIYDFVKKNFRSDLKFKDPAEKTKIVVLGEEFEFRDGKYCAKVLGGRGGPPENILYHITGYKKYSDKIEIYTKFTYTYFSGDIGPGKTTLYKDFTTREELYETEEMFDYKKLPEEIVNKLETYKFTFNLKDDNIFFYSVEKVK